MHITFPDLKREAVGVMYGERRVEEREDDLKGYSASTEAVFCLAAVTTATATLYTGLSTRFLYEEWCSSERFCVSHMNHYGVYDCVVSVIEGPEAVVDRKEVSARMHR